MSDWLPTPDQREIVEAVSDALVDILPLDRLHRLDHSDQTLLPALAELGALGIALDESVGGSGLGPVEEALLFERLGRQLASPAVLGSVLAAHAAGADAALAEGRAIAALGLRDTATEVLLFDDKGASGYLVLLGEGGATLRLMSGYSDRRRLDAGQWGMPLDRLRDAAGPKTESPAANPALGRRARLLIAAQLTGLADRARDMAVNYAKIREQFGRPIGSFQAVKHHCADMAVNALAARDLLAFAATALEQGREDAGFQVEAAVAVAIRAARTNAAINLQIHGGIGFSDECDAHLVVKHAHVWETLAGGPRATHDALRREASPLSAAPALH